MPRWLKVALKWFAGITLFGFASAVLIYIKFSQDLRAAHEKFRIFDVLAPVAVSKSISSGETEGSFSLDEPEVGLATKLATDELKTRVWRYRVYPSSNEPEMYSVWLFDGGSGQLYSSGATRSATPKERSITDSN
ncbi:MAG: hypothetical protein WCK51_02975 [Armatimonadota bacterium]